MRFHHLYKFTKEILSIVRTWRGLWVILHGKDGQVLMPHPFQGLIVEVPLSEFDFIRIERVGIDTESMVLGGDHHPTGPDVFDGLIGPAMAEFQFEGPPPQGQPQELVTQTDAENRFLP